MGEQQEITRIGEEVLADLTDRPMGDPVIRPGEIRRPPEYGLTSGLMGSQDRKSCRVRWGRGFAAGPALRPRLAEGGRRHQPLAAREILERGAPSCPQG